MPDINNCKQLIVCPECNGAKFKSAQINCPNCGGFGQGYFYSNKFFYLGRDYHLVWVVLRRLKKYADLAVTGIALTALVLGLIALFYFIWENLGYSDNILWQIWSSENHSLYLDFFWSSLLFGLFVVYRLLHTQNRGRNIINLKKLTVNTGENLPDNWRDLRKIKKSQKINVGLSFSSPLEKILEQTVKKTAVHGKAADEISLFVELLSDKLVKTVFYRLNIDPKEISKKITNNLAGSTEAPGSGLSVMVVEILIDSYLQAMEMRQKKVQPFNVLAPIIMRNSWLADLLIDFNLDQRAINNVINWLAINDQLRESYLLYKKMARFKPASAINHSYTALATPILNYFSHDLTLAAKWGRLEFCVGRSNELKKIFENFISGQTGVLLMGPEGSGKTNIIHGLAQLMVKEEVPIYLQDKRLLELDIARLVSGVDPAQASGRLEVIIDEVARAGNIVLFIENIENILGFTAGGESSLDLSEVLANAMEKHLLFCLATITTENYGRFFEHSALARQMSKVEVSEPEPDQAILMIESKIGYLESQYPVIFTYQAIEAAVNLSDKYMHEQYLPDKAIIILEKAAAKHSSVNKVKKIIDQQEVAIAVSEQSGVPVADISRQESELLLNLEQAMSQYVVGQKEALASIADCLRRSKANLRSGKRPIASFLFLGPTGVGKTEVAKTVAKVFFQNEKYFVRLDMSEYQHPNSVEKMIGDHDGASGYLTEAVRRSPYALILLDEFEKAHANILDLFLQVMDDGRLTDGQGRTIDFTNCVIIATSNIGAIYIEDRVRAGIDIDNIKQGLINDQLNKALKPELINRFDGIVVFTPLELAEVSQIARLMLKQTADELMEKGISLELTDEGVSDLAKLGYDPAFGARPLRRVIQDRLENEIAKLLLSKQLVRRDTLIVKPDLNLEIVKAKKI